MVQCAMLDGATEMPPWCAVSLASLQMVREGTYIALHSSLSWVGSVPLY